MQEIVKLVAEKTGISEPQAKMAVETVVAFLRTKLPAPIASQLDAVLGGGDGTPDLGKLAGDLAGGLGGMFGKK